MATPDAATAVLAAHRQGTRVEPALRYHDRIALLRIPIRNGALALGGTVSYGPFRPPHGPVTTAVRHTQTHDDLLVFSRQPSATAATSGAVAGEESSDV